MFASKTPRAQTACGACGRAFQDGSPHPGCIKWFHEWDRNTHVQHNAPNPILLELRTNNRDIYDLMLDLDSRWALRFTHAEVRHAREVLDRLGWFRIHMRTAAPS